MPFMDALNETRISGALSVQDLGILLGVVILISGLLLFLRPISDLERRYHELALKVESLSAASTERPAAQDAAPAVLLARTEKAPEGMPAGSPAAGAVTVPETGPSKEREADTVPAAVTPAEPTATPAKKEAEATRHAPSPAVADRAPPRPPPPSEGAPAKAPVRTQPPAGDEIEAHPAELPPGEKEEWTAPGPTPSTAVAVAGPSVPPSDGTPPASPTPSPATPGSSGPASTYGEALTYDYGTRAAQGATTCKVCGNELTGGICRYCITSTSIQNAYQELSKTQELGASVEEATVLLSSARQSLEENEYSEAVEYTRSALHFLEISAKTYFALRGAVEKAEADRRKLEDSGIDTSDLSALVSDVRSAIVKGNYPEAKAILDQERRVETDLRVPYFQRPSTRSAPEKARPAGAEVKFATSVARAARPEPRPAQTMVRKPADAAPQPQSTISPAARLPPVAATATAEPAAPPEARPPLPEPAPSPGQAIPSEAKAPEAEPPSSQAAPSLSAEPKIAAAGPTGPAQRGPEAPLPATEPPPYASGPEPGPEKTAPGPTTEPSAEPATGPVPMPAMKPSPEVKPAEAAGEPLIERRPAVPAVPKFSSGISGCPKCGRKTMKGWKKCPHCLTPLQ